MKYVLIGYGLSLIVFPFAISVTRSIVHARRARHDRFASTQDIAMWGTLAMFVWLVVGCVGFAFWIR